MPPLSIAPEPPRQPEVVELLRLSDEFALSLYPPESCYMLDLGELEADNVSVFVARDRDAADGVADETAGAAVGIAALVDRSDGTGEVKRMFVLDSARGGGVARALLRALEESAAARGIRTLQLETGPDHVAALALYWDCGYVVIPNFGQYVGDQFSVCLEKSIALR